MQQDQGDPNLLFGVMALQAGYLDGAHFAQACSAWAALADVSLAELLVQKGWLTAAARAEVEARLASQAVTRDYRNPVETTDTSAGGSFRARKTPGERPRFTILRVHAQGGLGRVNLARDERLRRQVALKEILPDCKDNPYLRQRFLTEAEITGGLEHPGIVPVYALEEDADGTPSYAMRFIQGRTLAEAIRAYHRQPAPLAFRDLLKRFVDICQAVAYAHSKGVIHRDLKPDNVMLGDYGETLVLDWGLAKRLGESPAFAAGGPPVEGAAEHQQPTVDYQPEDPRQEGLTRAGQVMGTPAYMSPEQAEGHSERIGPATDIYALGAILYQLLTGQIPFQKADQAAVLGLVRRGQLPAPGQVKPGVPKALEAVCQKAMARSIAGRYATAGDLAQEIQRFLADEPVAAYLEPWTVRFRRWRGRHRAGVNAAVAGVLVAAVCLGGATWLLANANTALTRQRDETQKQMDRADQNLGRARKAVEDYCTNVTEDQRLKQEDLFGLRQKLLETATPFYREFVEQHGDDPNLLAEQGRAFLLLGNLYFELGQHPQALAQYEQAAAVFQQLAHAHPEETSFRAKLGRSQTSRAGMLRKLDRVEEARAAFVEAINLEEPVVASRPDVPDYRSDLATSHELLGSLLGYMGRRDEARPEYQKAIDLWDEVVSTAPAAPAYRSKLAAARNSLGTLLYQHGQWQEARAQYVKALEIQTALVSQDPGRHEYRLHLSRSHNNLGALLREVGQGKEAVVEVQEAAKHLERLTMEQPSMPLYRAELATARKNLGTMLWTVGRRQEARAEYEKAIVCGDQLAAAFPAVPGYRFELASSRDNLGDLLREMGHIEAARLEFQKAVELLEKLMADTPQMLDYVAECATAYGNYAQLVRETGQPAESLVWFDKALSAIQRVLAKEPRLAAILYSRREVSGGKALALARLGRCAEAAELAGTLANDTDLADDGLFYTASALALCSVGDGVEPKAGQRNAEQAMALLRKGQQAGYFKDPLKLQNLKSSKDLDPLRQRQDFKKLLQDTENPADKGK